MKIIIVGAGIAGLSTAWALTKLGHEVILLEQGKIPNPMAASGDHHRIIRRAYGPDNGYGAAITEAYQAWDELWTDLGQKHYEERGFLCISQHEGDEAERYLEGMKNGGWPFELLTPNDAAQRWPFLDSANFRFAFFSQEGGALHCRRIATALVEWLLANGCDVRETSRAVSVDSESAKVTLTDGEEIKADFVIVTAGAWVTKLFPELSEQLTTYRTAVVYLEPPSDIAEAWQTAPVILDVGGGVDGYVIPRSGEGGLKFGSGLHKRPNTDADASRQPEENEGVKIRDLFSPPFARIDEYSVTEVVTCAYTFTDDERFFAYQKGKAVVVSACSGHGYKFGAAVGRRVASAIESRDFSSLQKWLRADVE